MKRLLAIIGLCLVVGCAATPVNYVQETCSGEMCYAAWEEYKQVCKTQFPTVPHDNFCNGCVEPPAESDVPACCPRMYGAVVDKRFVCKDGVRVYAKHRICPFGEYRRCYQVFDYDESGGCVRFADEHKTEYQLCEYMISPNEP